MKTKFNLENAIIKLLGTTAGDLNGHLVGDEFAVTPENGEIAISTEDEGATFWLVGQRPLYEIKKGRPKLVRVGTKGEDVGWHYAHVSADQLCSALAELSQIFAISDFFRAGIARKPA